MPDEALLGLSSAASEVEGVQEEREGKQDHEQACHPVAQAMAVPDPGRVVP
jgi:hypothetical protein